MAMIKPFKPLRPTSRFAGAVAAPPYDTVSVEEARQILQNNPLSFLKVLKPEVNIPFYSNSKKTVYTEARNALKEFINSGIFMQEEKLHFYIYTERADGRRQSGVVGLFSCKEYEESIIKRTEEIKYMDLEDRVQWIEHTNVQGGPVFLVYKEKGTVREIINKVMKEPPEYDFVTEDGVRHTVHSISEKGMIKGVQSAFMDIPTLYIADGNHGTLAACEVNKKRGGVSGFFLATAVAHTEVNIMEYNRVVRDLNGLSQEKFLQRLKQYFYVEKIGNHTVKPSKKHTLGMYLDKGWYKLTIKENYLDEANPLESLDVYFLEKYVLQTILGINSERGNGRIDFVSGKEGMSTLEEKVNKEGWAVSFALFPVAVSEVIQVADSGFLMPPKSTWFEPKFRSGLFLNPLKDILAEFKNEKTEDYNIWF